MASNVIGFTGRRGKGKTNGMTGFADILRYQYRQQLRRKIFNRYNRLDMLPPGYNHQQWRQTVNGLWTPSQNPTSASVPFKVPDYLDVRAAWQAANQIEALVDKYTPSICTNYWVSFADLLNEDIADWLTESLDDQKVRDLIVCIDEVDSVASRLRAISSINLNIGTFFKQIRKRNITILWSCQNPLKVDSEIFWQTDIMIECDAWFPPGRGIDMNFYDQWGQYTGDYRTASWPPPVPEPDAQWTLKDNYRWFNKYNTDQTITNSYTLKKKREAQEKAERLLARSRQADTLGAIPELDMNDEIERVMGLIRPEGANYRMIHDRFIGLGLSEARVKQLLEERNFIVEQGQRGPIVRKVGA